MVENLPLASVCPDPDQPRKDFNEKSIAELAQSIKENGLIQPITVRPDGERFLIITGERRYRAHLFAGLSTVKAIIDYAERDKSKTLAVQLIENLAREDMNPVDTAKGLQGLLDAGWQAEKISEQLGYGLSTVASKISLLKLEQRIQRSVATGQIPESIALMLTRLSKEGQYLALKKIRNKSCAEAKPIVDAILAQEQQVDLFAPPDSKREQNKIVRAYTMAMLATVSFMKKITGDDYRILANGLDDGRLGKRIDEIDLAVKGLKRIQRELAAYQQAKKMRRRAA